MKTPTTRSVALFAALLSASCAAATGPSPFSGSGSAAAAEPATIQVTNSGYDALAIYGAEGGARLGTVMPGQTECIELRRFEGRAHVSARSVGGGRTTTSPVFDAVPGQGWQWELGTTPRLDRLSLVRTEQCS